jgi:hypothetical protein
MKETFSNAALISFVSSGDQGEAHETLKFAFTCLLKEYTPQNSDGSAGTTVSSRKGGADTRHIAWPRRTALFARLDLDQLPTTCLPPGNYVWHIRACRWPSSNRGEHMVKCKSYSCPSRSRCWPPHGSDVNAVCNNGPELVEPVAG